MTQAKPVVELSYTISDLREEFQNNSHCRSTRKLFWLLRLQRREVTFLLFLLSI